MKKLILLAAIGGLFSNAQAQGPAFGLKGGLNFSTLNVEGADQKGRFGFNGGVFGRTSPGLMLGLQAELLYSTRGSSADYSAFFGLVDQNVDFRLNYIELPLLLSIRPVEILDLHVGGYAGYLLSAQVKTSGDLGTATETLDRDNFKSLDAGVAIGAALNLGPAQIGVRYLHGLTKIAEGDAADLVLGDARNSCLQMYVGIGITGQ